MNKQNITSIVCAIAFLFGTFLVLGNGHGVDASVIGYSGPQDTSNGLIGIVLVIASAGLFFVSTTTKEEHTK